MKHLDFNKIEPTLKKCKEIITRLTFDTNKALLIVADIEDLLNEIEGEKMNNKTKRKDSNESD